LVSVSDTARFRARLRSVILSFGQRFTAARIQRDEIVADGGNLLDQVLPGRIVPAVNGVGVVGHAGHLARLDNGQGRAERNRYFL
jgi:hypothetical protein